MTLSKEQREKIIEISIVRLEQIAEYYEFPLAVFFGGKLEGKRTQNLTKNIRELKEKLTEIIDDYL